MEEDHEIPNLQAEAHIAIRIFREESVDGILDRGIGINQALNECMRLGLGVPRLSHVRDLLFLIENIEGEGDFIEETYITFFLECFRIIKIEFEDVATPEDEVFSIDKQFIARRLSDLQPVSDSDFSFTFSSFLVSNAGISEISNITNFDALLNVSLKGNIISDLTPLTKLPRLKSLDLSENRVKKVSNVHFPKLESLNLSNNIINTIESLSAPLLLKANFANNRVFYISPNALYECNNLEELILSSNCLRTVKEGILYGLNKLRVLKIESNGLTSLKYLFSKYQQELNDLDVSDNPISSIESLKVLPNLEVLDLHKTNVSLPNQLEHLTELPYLHYMYIYETPLSEVENVRLELIRFLPNIIEIDEQPITVLEKQESAQMIADREAEEQRALLEAIASVKNEEEDLAPIVEAIGDTE